MTPIVGPVPERIFVSVGSSLGDRLALVAFAARSLAAQPGICVAAGSRLYDTAPAGGVAQRRFLNGVLELAADPEWDPPRLLDALLGIEAAAGRTRSLRWEDRTLDLDLILYGARRQQTPRLTLPHPQLHLRRFVLMPLCDLAPGTVHPTLDRTLAGLLASLAPDPRGCIALAPEAHPETWPQLPLSSL